MRVRPGRNWTTVDVARIVRTVSAGKVSESGLIPIKAAWPAFLASSVPKQGTLPEGWMERSSYVLTGVPEESWDLLPGDIVTYGDTKHVVRKVNRDLQGNYYTATLEASAK